MAEQQLRVCRLNSDGHILEAQTGGLDQAGLDVLVQNAVNVGYQASEVTASLMGEDEFRILVAQQNKAFTQLGIQQVITTLKAMAPAKAAEWWASLPELDKAEFLLGKSFKQDDPYLQTILDAVGIVKADFLAQALK